MAVFSDSEQAVRAALEAQQEIEKIVSTGTVLPCEPGVHRGNARKVKGDFLGVDVNIAARVGDCAKGGEVLISEPVREELDDAASSSAARRELSASGAPADLTVCSVKSRRRL